MADSLPGEGEHEPSGKATATASPAQTDCAPSAVAEGTSLAHTIDDMIWTWLFSGTRGASPIAMSTAWFDWLAHMAISPGHRAKLAVDGAHKAAEGLGEVYTAWLEAASGWPPAPEAADTGLRALTDMYDAWQGWLAKAVVEGARGVSVPHARRVAFSLEQWLEAWHPRNFYWTNPDALAATREERGANLLRGWQNLTEDLRHPGRNRATGALGDRLAPTPGRVVYRNRLIELIQYDPQTEEVLTEPILIVPAWILKYYILDLNAQSSLVRYLVDQGFTVYMISWRNPGREDRDLSFDAYRRLGVQAALDAIGAHRPKSRVHAVGYCLGGTLLAVTAAALARDGTDPLASLTLLAAQVDFRDAGDLALFIDEAQLAALDADMNAIGYLDGSQMAAAFTLLRARDLVWRRFQEEYLLGKRGELIDLMIWNADTTRMPRRMHSEYLRHFFLNNDFVQGRCRVDGRPVAVSDIRAPIFALGTQKDHVAPWESVFKIHLFADTDVTFALTNGGHNAGVVSPPGHPRRHHRIHTKADSDHYVSPDDWLELAESRDGSWWPSWVDWLAARSSGRSPAPVPARVPRRDNMLAEGADLPAAPGRYVREAG